MKLGRLKQEYRKVKVPNPKSGPLAYSGPSSPIRLKGRDSVKAILFLDQQARSEGTRSRECIPATCALIESDPHSPICIKTIYTQKK